MESEFLSRISLRQRVFLTRTAVLERMCGPLCDAVLDTGGSAVVVADLAKSNVLLVPLDRRGEWYRYHHLFRDMLLAELGRREPAVMPVLRRRAGGWCLDNSMPEAALEYSMAAGDVDGARPPGRAACGVGLPAGPGHDHLPVVRVAGGPGRDRGTPDGGGARFVIFRADGPPG